MNFMGPGIVDCFNLHTFGETTRWGFQVGDFCLTKSSVGNV